MQKAKRLFKSINLWQVISFFLGIALVASVAKYGLTDGILHIFDKVAAKK